MFLLYLLWLFVQLFIEMVAIALGDFKFKRVTPLYFVHIPEPLLLYPPVPFGQDQWGLKDRTLLCFKAQKRIASHFKHNQIISDLVSWVTSSNICSCPLSSRVIQDWATSSDNLVSLAGIEPGCPACGAVTLYNGKSTCNLIRLLTECVIFNYICFRSNFSTKQ